MPPESTNDGPPSKRQRIDSDPGSSTQSSTPLIRSSIWLDDGNIVLQAQSTQFRVHKSVLALHSSVFKDMFAIPQPQGNDASDVEGCPLVQVDDAAEDMQRLLEALYIKPFHSSSPQPLPLIATMLLGNKYEFFNLRKDALECLKKSLPMTLPGLDVRMFKMGIKDQPDLTFDIVDLVRREALDMHLPCALYDCLKFDADTILGGFHKMGSDDTGISRTTLSLADQILCFNAKDMLLKLQTSLTYKWLCEDGGIPCQACVHVDGCAFARKTLFCELWEKDLTKMRVLDPWNEEWDRDFCHHCSESAKDIHECNRGLLWDMLPRIFRLRNSWKMLLKEGKS